MKKILSILFIGLTLTGCLSKPIENNEVVLNIKECQSLDELNKSLNLSMTFLSSKDSSNPSFLIIDDEIGEFTFDLSGLTYSLRGSRTLDKDISGKSIDNEPAFKDMELDVDYASTNTFKAVRFVLSNTQYVLIVEDNELLSKDEFLKVSAELIKTIGENSQSNYPYSK